jgi:lysozyme family protein
MTSYFKNKIIPFLWKWEGTTYENDPDDPGGATKYGIDQRSHPKVDIKNLTAEEATDIYWNEWIKDGCDHLPSPLDWLFFDACVNCGMGRAQQFLTASAKDPKKFQKERIDFYNRLADQKPRLSKYRKGWISRVIDLSKVAGVV